jgi:hypothetical protein
MVHFEGAPWGIKHIQPKTSVKVRTPGYGHEAARTCRCFSAGFHTIQNCAESGYGAVYNSLKRYQGYFHGESRDKVRGNLAIMSSCHEASSVTWTARDFVS